MASKMDELKQIVLDNEKRISIQEAIAQRIEKSFADFASEFKLFSHELKQNTASREYVDGKFATLQLQIKNLSDCVRDDNTDNQWLKSQLWEIVKFIIFGVMGAGLALIFSGKVSI